MSIFSNGRGAVYLKNSYVSGTETKVSRKAATGMPCPIAPPVSARCNAPPRVTLRSSHRQYVYVVSADGTAEKIFLATSLSRPTAIKRQPAEDRPRLAARRSKRLLQT
jgi:hypothetical protein